MNYRITTKNGWYRIEYEALSFWGRKEWRAMYRNTHYNNIQDAQKALKELQTRDDPWTPITSEGK